MSVFPELLADLARPLALTLAHSLWQGALVALLLAIVLGLTPRRADLRHACACAALVLCLVLPAVTFVVVAEGSDPASGIAAAVPPVAGPAVETARLETAADRPAPASAAPAPSPPWRDLGRRLAEGLHGKAPLIAALWLIGVLLLGAWHLGGWLRTRNWVGLGRPAAPELLDRVAAIAARLGLRRRLRVLITAAIDVPAVVGWLRPTLLVPVSVLTGLSPQQLDLILAHELAHIRRWDPLVAVLQVVAETLLFHQPAVWWISMQIRRERELCCDDVAVSVGGDRLAYARALLTLEEQRTWLPAVAQGAGGGSLLHRILRLTGGSPMRSTLTPSRLAGLTLVLIALTAGAALTLAASGSPLNVAQASDRDDGDRRIDGTWRLKEGRYGGRVQLRHDRDDDHESTMTLRLDDDQLEQLREGRGDLVIARDAGVITLERDRDETRGDFGFRPDRGFADWLDDRGLRGPDRDEQLVMACNGVDRALVEGLADAGHAPDDLDMLIAAGIHRVTPAFAREMDGLFPGLDLEELIAFRVHDIDRSYVRELDEMGFRGLAAGEVMSMRIHNIDADYVRELDEMGFRDLDAGEAVSMRIHHIDADYVRELAELGFRGLSAEEIMSMSIHGIDARFLHRMAEAGYDDLSPEQALAFSIHRVDARFVRELAERGYRDLDPEELVGMRIHHITPQWIDALEERGIRRLDVDELVRLKISGVDL